MPKLSVVRADILPSQVIGVYFRRPVTFDYKAGQWVKIASAAQNPGEFHSFTISSAPHEEYLSLHIRAVGPWTYNFRENYNPTNLQWTTLSLNSIIDGPFGEGHQDWFRYEVAVLVGGGIGVTPFASILKELVHRFNIGARIECRKVGIILDILQTTHSTGSGKPLHHRLKGHVFIHQLGNLAINRLCIIACIFIRYFSSGSLVLKSSMNGSLISSVKQKKVTRRINLRFISL